MSNAIKEDIVGFCFVGGFIVVLFFGGWWMGVGMDRSEYKYCLSEYSVVYPTDKQGAFRYCYEKTY